MRALLLSLTARLDSDCRAVNENQSMFAYVVLLSVCRRMVSSSRITPSELSSSGWDSNCPTRFAMPMFAMAEMLSLGKVLSGANALTAPSSRRAGTRLSQMVRLRTHSRPSHRLSGSPRTGLAGSVAMLLGVGEEDEAGGGGGGGGVEEVVGGGGGGGVEEVVGGGEDEEDIDAVGAVASLG